MPSEPDPTAADATERPLVVLSSSSEVAKRIFTPDARSRLEGSFELVALKDEDDPTLDEVIDRAFAVIGQPDLPAERLVEAKLLKAVVNVEGNFLSNIDYPIAFARGIRVLGCGPAYAQAVAEFGVGLALDLARGISREDRAFRRGEERYLGGANQDAILLAGADVGFIGLGNLGRSLRRLLTPFDPVLRIHDPWLPDSVLRELGAQPCTLEEVLDQSQFIFVLAAATDTNEGLLGAAELRRIRPGGRLLLLSRAAVVDFDALLDAVEDGRLVAAIDVWPTEPVPLDNRARGLEGLVLSPHRAGGIPSAFFTIGDMVVDDLTSLAAGIPPTRMQSAEPELVGHYRNRPAAT